MICTIHVNNHRQLIYTLLIITLCSEVKRNQKKTSKTKKEHLHTLCMVGTEKKVLLNREDFR